MKKTIPTTFLVLIGALLAVTAIASDTQFLTKALASVSDQAEIPAIATAFVMKVPKESRLATLDAMLRQVANHYPAQLPGFVWRVSKADLKLVPGIVSKVAELRSSGVIVSYASFAQGGTPMPPEPPKLGTIGYTMRGDAVVIPVAEAVGVIGLDERRVRSRR